MMKNPLLHPGRDKSPGWFPRLLIVACWLMLAPAFGQSGTPTPYSFDNQLDLNNAGYEEIARLPIEADLAERIYDHIQFSGPFESIYELNKLPGMSQQLFLKLKPLVRIEPFEEKSDREERIESLYYQLDRWSGGEGTNQALVDSWIEQALSPLDANQVRHEQLLNMNGVSPVDAASIIRYRDQVGGFSSQRDMRSTPYLSYFGFRNARTFLSFEAPERKREFHGNLLFRSTNTPFFADEEEASQDVGFVTELNEAPEVNTYPEVYTRFIGSYGSDIKFGYSYFHALEEPVISYDAGLLEIPKGKFYLGIEDKAWGDFKLNKLYVGNYAMAFGQGVVMENTDFFTPRKSGFGFRKRFIGLSGDNSQTRTYKSTGIATQLAFKNANLFLFGAFDKRDAILNTNTVLVDGEEVRPFNQIVVLDQRFRAAPAADGVDIARTANPGLLEWRDTVKELMYGFHASYDFAPGTQLGVTYYESAYDRPLRPTMAEIVLPAEIDQVSMPDNEIFAAYGGAVSDGTNPFWDAAKSFRRVYGINGQTVFRNLALQAEYAELDKGEGVSLFGSEGNPWAFTGNAYLQYNSFSLLGLYRNYQLDFDNPYQRSFSNYRRYKRTIYEDYFYLQSPLYSQLYYNNPQPQSEEGFYLSTRYQFHRKWVANIEYDNWRRQADDVTQFRLRGTLQYRPVFPVTVNLYQKYQGREVSNNVSLEYFQTNEFRGNLRLRLSRFNELGLIYLNAVTKFRSRPRFIFPVNTNQTGQNYNDSNYAGNIASPSQVIGGSFTHNFNEWLKLRGSILYLNGFFWNFEDTQFFVVDSPSGAIRYWLSLYSRISPKVSMRLKYTRNMDRGINNVQTRDNENVPIIARDGRYYMSNLVQPLQ
ncbi:MAG: helix-hairpin-helix domain-containing protein, partial [Calditrichaeota bacterium]|nr:helix-hairpin-helix domain-containing protein [Calditrichota bacterium]